MKPLTSPIETLIGFNPFCLFLIYLDTFFVYKRNQ